MQHVEHHTGCNSNSCIWRGRRPGFSLLARYYAAQAKTQRRLQTGSTELREAENSHGLHTYIAHYFDERRFHLGRERREKLRRELLKAGYFDVYAVNYYVFARIVVIILLPTVGYLISQVLLIGAPLLGKVAFVAICALIAIFGPDAYLARRQRILSQRYQLYLPTCLTSCWSVSMQAWV